MKTVHSGKTMDSGHYYSIIKSKEDGQWYKFDDRRVTPFPQEALDEGHELFIGEVYMLFFEKKIKVEKGVFSTKKFSEEEITLPSLILKDISFHNSEMLQKRQFYEPEYFDFIYSLIKNSPFNKNTYKNSDHEQIAQKIPKIEESSSSNNNNNNNESQQQSGEKKKEGEEEKMEDEGEGEEEEENEEEENKKQKMENLEMVKNKQNYKRYEAGDEEKDVSLKSCMLAFYFVFETALVNKNRQLFRNWKEALINIFSESPSACGWMLDLLSTTRREKLLKYCLVETTERWLREGFGEFLSHSLKVLAPYEYSLFPSKVDTTEDTKFFQYLEKKKKREQEHVISFFLNLTFLLFLFISLFSLILLFFFFFFISLFSLILLFFFSFYFSFFSFLFLYFFISFLIFHFLFFLF